MLAESLCEKEIKAIHGEGKTDVKIVKTSVEKRSILPTMLIGDDTDLLVCYFFMPIAFPTRYIIFQKQNKAV